MQTIHYKRGDMYAQAIGCALFSIMGGWLAFHGHGKLMILGAVLALSLPIAAIALTARAMGDCVALRFDRQGLYVASLWRSAKLSWPELRKIHRETLVQSSAFGLFKRKIAFYIVITAADEGSFERSFKINERLLDWPQDGMEALVADMARVANTNGQTAVGASERANTPSRARPSLGGTAGEPDFDPDAVMARYLAERDADGERAPLVKPRIAASPRPQFGRRAG